MLNRHILRIKAMQSLYSFIQAKKSNFGLALIALEEAYAPDLNASIAPDLDNLKKNLHLATQLFEKNYLSETITSTLETAPLEIKKPVIDTIRDYHNQNKKDQDYFGKLMANEAEKISDRYLLILQLLVEITKKALMPPNKKISAYTQANTYTPPAQNLENNKIIQILSNSVSLEKELIRKGITWHKEEDQDFVKKLYNEIKKDEIYIAYAQKEALSLEEDKELIRHLLRKYVFQKSETPPQVQVEEGEKKEEKQIIPFYVIYFEEWDINWTENRNIIKSMLAKTIKEIEADSHDITLVQLSKDWEEDKAFFINLFKNTALNDEDYEIMLAEKIHNWSPERLAVLDKIIIKMGISEILNFSSIPLKVTMNEYLEIAKQYSSPQSKPFINGVLDTIAQELKEKNLIKKSGRGLLDNK